MQINDQIFQIGDTNVRSMSSEQVASVLRQSSMHGQVIKFIVARPVHNNITDIDLVQSKDPDSESFKNILNDLNKTSNNQNSQCLIIKTNEIMDKNLNLSERLTNEFKKRKAAEESKDQSKTKSANETLEIKTTVEVNEIDENKTNDNEIKELKNNDELLKEKNLLTEIDYKNNDVTISTITLKDDDQQQSEKVY